jgi:hypothetical protein
MKIGMMCLWNAANGPSIHAELVGRAWVKLGHKLKVFSAEKHPDARPTLQKDEDFVIRHFSVNEVSPFTRAASFDPSPLLNEEYEVFVAQNVERLPADKLLEVFPEIKKKAVTVQVVHEGKAPEDPLYYKLDWDAIVCFDQRYKDYLAKSFSAERIHMTPYPYHPLELGNKGKARERQDFPLDKKIVFSFGFRLKDIVSVLPALKDVDKEYPLRYVIIANPGSEVDELREAQKIYDHSHRMSCIPTCMLRMHCSFIGNPRRSIRQSCPVQFARFWGPVALSSFTSRTTLNYMETKSGNIVILRI